MNGQTTKTLRSLFQKPFPEGDSRNKGAWRQFKTTYKGLPWGARHLFIKGLKQLESAREAVNG